MGGLGPGIGGFELVVIGIVALLVVGPKDLPLLMRRVGQLVAKARGMANDFRASFDEMARQSELDELRKEVDALRKGQGMFPLGEEAANAFKDINNELTKPLVAAPAVLVAEAENTQATSVEELAVEQATVSEWPEPEELVAVPAADAVEPVADKPAVKSKPRAKRTKKADPA